MVNAWQIMVICHVIFSAEKKCHFFNFIFHYVNSTLSGLLVKPVGFVRDGWVGKHADLAGAGGNLPGGGVAYTLGG